MEAPAKRFDVGAALGGAAVAAAAVAAYGRTFRVPFLYDDFPAIVWNGSIRHWATALIPPANTTAGGRPALNLSFAANYAGGGLGVAGYHAANLAVLVLGALLLYGVVRRTLAPRLPSDAARLALCASLLWACHPLLTESVTYLAQRAESLMGLFYLLTLYAFVRGSASAGGAARGWLGLSVVACLLGMATKETMVSAPLVVLLYDRAFVAGGSGAALRLRWGYYSALAATWIPLAILVAAAHGRGGSAGFGSGVSWWRYALFQPAAVLRYLRLSVFPHPLVFDYGAVLPAVSWGSALGIIAVLGLVGAAAWAAVKHPQPGFLGAAFFAILAPSSSVVPVATESMAEHRMYLPLAAVAVLAVLLVHRLAPRAVLPLSLAAAAALFAATWRRNETYRSPLALWGETAAECPGNYRAHVYLANALADAGRRSEAVGEYRWALELRPDDPEAHTDLGNVYAADKRFSEAAVEYEAALRENPEQPEPRHNLGNVLLALGRPSDAVAQYRGALRLRPEYPAAHKHLADALVALGDDAAALPEYEEAVREQPDFPEARNNLGNLLNAAGRHAEAIAQFQEAVREAPAFAPAHFNLALTLGFVGRYAEAAAELRSVVRLDPGNEQAQSLLERLRAGGY